MTAYIETRTVAHIMEWRDGAYEAACRSYKQRIRGRDFNRGRNRDWPIRYATVDKQPGKPWCRLCVAEIRRRISYWVETVPAIGDVS